MDNGVEVEQVSFKERKERNIIQIRASKKVGDRERKTQRFHWFLALRKQLEKQVWVDDMRHKMKEMRYKMISLSLGNMVTFSLKFQ